MVMLFLRLDNEAGRIFGALVVAAAGYVWWRWLRVDAPLHKVPRSSVLTALILYVVVFPLAVVGYLFYSRGLSNGFTSASWFVLYCVTLVAAIVAEIALLNAIFSTIPIAL